ncbi:MAG: tetratricopeptide repeat protein [Bacteroidia bacterium]
MRLVLPIALLFLSAQLFGQSKAEAVLKRAIIKEKAYAYDEAVAILDSALAIDPKFAEAHYIRGLCLAQLNNIDAAEEEFRNTVKLDDKHAMAYYNMGYWKDVRGNKQGALIDMQKAWQYASSNTDIGLEYINLLYEFKKKDEACTVIAKLVENGSQLANEMQQLICN